MDALTARDFAAVGAVAAGRLAPAMLVRAVAVLVTGFFARSAVELMLVRVLWSMPPEVGVTELRAADGALAVLGAVGLVAVAVGRAVAVVDVLAVVVLGLEDVVEIMEVGREAVGAVEVRRVAVVEDVAIVGFAVVVAAGFVVAAAPVVVLDFAAVVAEVAAVLVVAGPAAVLEGGLLSAPVPNVPEFRTFFTMGVVGPLADTLVLRGPVVEVFLTRASCVTAARGRGMGAGSGTASGSASGSAETAG